MRDTILKIKPVIKRAIIQMVLPLSSIFSNKNVSNISDSVTKKNNMVYKIFIF